MSSFESNYTKELFRDGEFRIAQYSGSDSSNGDTIIQHHHLGYKGRTSFDNDDWSYCFYGTRSCVTCQTKVPTELIGIHNMVEWDR